MDDEGHTVVERPDGRIVVLTGARVTTELGITQLAVTASTFTEQYEIVPKLPVVAPTLVSA